MKKAKLTKCTLPKNGCARCIWWRYYIHQPWGSCRLFGEDKWYQAPPCPEYERDGFASDELELYLGEE